MFLKLSKNYLGINLILFVLRKQGPRNCRVIRTEQDLSCYKHKCQKKATELQTISDSALSPATSTLMRTINQQLMELLLNTTTPGEHVMCHWSEFPSEVMYLGFITKEMSQALLQCTRKSHLQNLLASHPVSRTGMLFT